MSGGNGHLGILTFTSPPQRIVSLVPSMTASLYDLDAGGKVVGVTDYCMPPQSAEVTRVGGTRQPDVELIARLSPDLIIANQEENSRAVVEAMEARGLKVWVTFPRSIQEALSVLWALVRVLGTPEQGVRIRTLEMTLEWTQRASQAGRPFPVFCPIWHDRTGDGLDWWMTFNRHTYADDVLTCCGGMNVFRDRLRRYPLEADIGPGQAEEAGERDTRYPRLGAAEIGAAEPGLVLLPDEPMRFGAEEEQILRTVLAGTPAIQENRVVHIDGRLLTWHGTMLAQALAALPAVLAG